jgi:hypothetical protein
VFFFGNLVSINIIFSAFSPSSSPNLTLFIPSQQQVRCVLWFGPHEFVSLGEKSHVWFWRLKPNSSHGAKGFDAGSNAATAIVRKGEGVKQKSGARTVLQCAVVLAAPFPCPLKKPKSSIKQKQQGDSEQQQQQQQNSNVNDESNGSVSSSVGTNKKNIKAKKKAIKQKTKLELVAPAALIVAGGTDGAVYVFAPNSGDVDSRKFEK